MFRQRIVSLIQVGLVFLVCALAYAFGPSLAPRPTVADTAGRLGFAVEWLAVPAAALLAFVVLTSLSRFFDDDAFGGTRAPASRFIETNIRVTQNTVEQCLLAAIAWCGLALALPAERLGLIPVLALLFAAGRVLFWAGYQLHPVARALGFGLTAVPTAVALIWLVWRLVA